MSTNRWRAVAVLACALGMACKESMVTAPVIVALFDRLFRFDSFHQAWRVRRHLYIGLALTWLLLAALLATNPRPHSAGLSAGITPWLYLLNQPPVLIRYFKLAFWPRSLVLLYGSPQPTTLSAVLPEALLMVALIALTCVGLRRRSMWGFLGAWVWITLSPTSTLVPIATEVAAERRMYLPLAAVITGTVLAMVWAWHVVTSRAAWRLHPGVAPLTAAMVVSTVAVGLASGTVARNDEYASPVVMARTILARYPTPVAHLSLGRALLDAGDRDEGMRHLEEALPGAPAAHVTLGLQLLSERKTAEALAHLQAFVRDQPAFLADAIIARAAIGRVFLDQEQWAAAAEEFRTILQTLPDNPMAQQSLAEAEIAQGLWEPAVRHYRAYLAHVPTDAGALNNLGMALGSLGVLTEAKAAFEQALVADPNHAQAHHNLAGMFLGELDLDQALWHARRSVVLQPDDSDAHELLGRILLRKGRLAEAEMQVARALSLNPQSTVLRDELDQLRKVYQAHHD
jgi:tetratricopeptide (TPR) repeat protein